MWTSLLIATSVASAGSSYSFVCTTDQLSGVHASTLRVYRNEVYARRGRSFQSADLKAFFEATPWYKPDPTYADTRLTDHDRACVALISELENKPTAPKSPDLDGDGTGDPVTWDGQTLKAGHASLVLVPTAPPSPHAEPLVVVDLDLTDPFRDLVVVVDPGIEDERQIQVVRLENGVLKPLFETAPWLPHSAFTTSLRTLQIEDRNCGQQTTTSWTWTGTAFEQHSRVVGAHKPELCAACPFVFRVDGDQPTFLGEILRNQSEVRLQRPDPLALGPVNHSSLVLRLVELKPETTFLDHIYVEVDGTRYAPSDCGAHCTADHQYTRIDHATAVDLHFAIDRPGTATLVADGDYLPHEADHPTLDGWALKPVP